MAKSYHSVGGLYESEVNVHTKLERPTKMSWNLVVHRYVIKWVKQPFQAGFNRFNPSCPKLQTPQKHDRKNKKRYNKDKTSISASESVWKWISTCKSRGILRSLHRSESGWRSPLLKTKILNPMSCGSDDVPFQLRWFSGSSRQFSRV